MSGELNAGDIAKMYHQRYEALASPGNEVPWADLPSLIKVRMIRTVMDVLADCKDRGYVLVQKASMDEALARSRNRERSRP